MKKFLKSLLIATMVVGSISTTVFASTSKAGWVQNLSGNYSYYDTGQNTPVTGFKQIDGQWFYFDTTGAMKKGWLNKSNGYDNQWFYFNPGGTMHTNWLSFDGHYYFFGNDGVLKTGWFNSNGFWYFSSINGVVQEGVIQVDGSIYKLSPQMEKGLLSINGVNYTFGQDGAAYGNLPTPDKAFTHYGVNVNAVTPTENTDFPSDTPHNLLLKNSLMPTTQTQQGHGPLSSINASVAPGTQLQSQVPAYNRDGGNTNSHNTVNSHNTKNSNNTTVINNYYNYNSNDDDEESSR